MPARRYIDAAEQFRILRVGDIVYGGAARLAHMADIKRAAVDPHLAAAGAIDMRHMFGVAGLRHINRF